MGNLTFGDPGDFNIDYPKKTPVFPLDLAMRYRLPFTAFRHVALFQRSQGTVFNPQQFVFGSDPLLCAD